MSRALAAVPTAVAVLAGVSACAAAGRSAPPPARPPAAMPAAIVRALPLGIGGSLDLRFPPAWKIREERGNDAVPPTFRIEPGDGSFALLVTPLWNPHAPGAAADPGVARALADEARARAVAGSAEGALPLREISGDGVRGFFFESTDRALADRADVPRGEFRHLLQGVVAVGRVFVQFTLLDDGDGPQRAATLEAMRTARDAPGAVGGDEAFEPDPRIATVPLQLRLPGRQWAVLVDLPGFGAAPPRRIEGDGTFLVLARNEESGVVASVALRTADGTADARACRERDLARIRARVPAMHDLAVSDANGAVRARYAVAEVDGKLVRQANAHRWLAREDVCVNVHVSLMDPSADAGAALESILASVRFGESL